MQRSHTLSLRGSRARAAAAAGVAVVVAASSVLFLLFGQGVAAYAEESSVPAGSIGIRLMDVPTDAAEDPRALMYIVDHVVPGTVIERRVLVANGSSEQTDVGVYSAAATVKDGVFQGADGHAQNELSSWTSIGEREPVIRAGAEQTIMVTVAIPRDAPPGEQYAVVWAETSATIETGVAAVNRVGIRMYLSVGPGGAPAADFSVDSLTAARSETGEPTILASVRNTGGRALDIFGELTLSDGPGGLSAGPFPAVLGTTVGIGTEENVTIALDAQIPAGPWNAQLTLRSGLLERSVSGTVTFPDVGSAAPVETDTGPSFLAVLTTGAVAVLVLLLIAVTVVSVRRRDRTVVAGTA